MIAQALAYFVGAALIALGLIMAANRAGYVVFIVGPRTLIALAALIAALGVWFGLTIR
jgi:hypothetical protein